MASRMSTPPLTLSDYTPVLLLEAFRQAGGTSNVTERLNLHVQSHSSHHWPINFSQRTNPFLSHEHHTSYRHNNTPTKACATSVNQLVRQWKKNTPRTTNNKRCRSTRRTQQKDSPCRCFGERVCGGTLSNPWLTPREQSVQCAVN